MRNEELVRKAQSGDKEAFNRLIVEYQDVLYRVAKSRISNEDDICDIVQDTLISAYKAIGKLNEEKYFKTWIIKILINKCNDFYKRPGKDNISFELLEYDKVLGVEENRSNFEFEDLTQGLNIEEKTLLNLYYAEGYKEKEISKILDIKYATVRTKMKRIKDKLLFKMKDKSGVIR